MDKNLRDKLLEDIKKTGYPVELRVGDIFSKHGWSVQYNKYYLDRDEQKGKEIDISAYTTAHAEKVIVGLYLLCEIKKSSDKPWVVFSSKRGFVEVEGWLRLHHSYGVDHHILPYESIEDNCSSSGFSRIGRSYHEGFKSYQEHSKIFKALTSSVKASEDCLGREREALEDFGLEGIKQIYFADPTVVLDGFLYEAYLNDKAELQLNEIGHIPVSFGYVSSKYKRRDYLIDVVTIKELPSLLALKRKWIDGMRDSIVKNMSQNT